MTQCLLRFKIVSEAFEFATWSVARSLSSFSSAHLSLLEVESCDRASATLCLIAKRYATPKFNLDMQKRPRAGSHVKAVGSNFQLSLFWSVWVANC